MVQIIASDMDGTLLNDKMVISKRNAAAVKEAQNKASILSFQLGVLMMKLSR